MRVVKQREVVGKGVGTILSDTPDHQQKKCTGKSTHRTSQGRVRLYSVTVGVGSYTSLCTGRSTADDSVITALKYRSSGAPGVP